MKLVKSSNHISFLDRILNKNNPSKNVGPTLQEERKIAEEKAVEHEGKRIAQASKFPKFAASSEEHPGFKSDVTDEHRIIEKASRALKQHISNLVGKGGFVIDLDEFRTREAHKDKVDASTVTDTALLSFAIDFTLPKGTRTAKFVVSYNESNDDTFKVENIFYGHDDKEYELTSENLTNYLSNTENDSVKTAKAEKLLVWFNPTLETIVPVETTEATTKITARLKTAGFAVADEYIDATYDPKQFGRICTVVTVPLNRVDEFKKIAAMSDADWTDRGLEKPAGYKLPKEKAEWQDRGLEKGGYDKQDLKGEKWVGRAEEKAGHGSYGNPYNTEAKQMFAEGQRKEAVKKALAEKKPEANGSIMEKVEKLEKLLN